MKILILLLMLAGQFSFAAEEECDNRLRGNPLDVLIQEIAQGDLERTVNMSFLLRVDAVTPTELSKILALQSEGPSRPSLKLREITGSGESVFFQFTLSGTGRQAVVLLADLGDPKRMRQISAHGPDWSVVSGVNEEELVKIPAEPLLMPIDELQIPVVVKAAFLQTGRKFQYVGDLVVRTEAEIMRVHGIGTRSLQEVKAALATLGLSLGMDTQDWPAKRQALLNRLDSIGQDVFRKKITELEMSVRTTNALVNDNIVYVGDLVSLDAMRVSRIPNLGRRCLLEIKETLNALGLHLGMVVPDWPYEDLKGVSD